MFKNRIGSVFKDANKTSYNFSNELKKESNVLIPDGYDGWHVIPFTSNKHKVDIFEPEEVFISGGVDTYENTNVVVKGLKKRLDAYKVEKLVRIEKKSFYESKECKTYDFIYACNTIHRSCNKDYTIEEKVNKLKQATKKNDRLYLYYYIANDEEDYNLYPKNLYPRSGEIIKYFENDEWELLFYKERNKLRLHKAHFRHSNDHYHKIGYIYAKKKNKKRQSVLNNTFHFNINIHGLSDSAKEKIFNIHS